MTTPVTARMLAIACGGSVIGCDDAIATRWVRPEDADCGSHVSWFRRDRPVPQGWPGGIALVDRVRSVPSWTTQILVDNARLGFASAAGQYSLDIGEVVRYSPWAAVAGPSVHPSAVVGADGQGYVKDGRVGHVDMPHLGGVLIDACVTIHAGAVIVRAVLGDTTLGVGASIGCNATIGHGATICDGAHIGAGANIGGSAVIGTDAAVWMGAVVRNGVKVGDRATIGMGAVVTRNVPAGETWVGNPARPIGSSGNESTTVTVAPYPLDANPRDSARRVREKFSVMTEKDGTLHAFRNMSIDATIDPSRLHREPYFVGSSTVCNGCKSTICEGC